MCRLLIAFIAILYFSISPVRGQRAATVGFWNTENFFDTIPSLFYDDRDYTPAGKQAWGTERYANKLRNVARVLDDMSLDVVGLCEVENEGVVYDLALRLETDYNYIHRIAGRSRGRDIALLYKGDRFVPHDVRTVDSRTARTFLYVKGELCGERVDLVVVHLPSMLNKYEYRRRAAERLFSFADSLHRADPDSRIIIMGDFNAEPADRVLRSPDPGKADRISRHPLSGLPGSADSALPGIALFCPFEPLSDDGMGTCAYGSRWLLYDNVLISERLLCGDLRYAACGIFIKEYMLDRSKTKRRGFPLRTFTGRKYTDGFSDHLPVYIKLELPAAD